MANRQYVEYNDILLLILLLEKPSSPSAKPPTPTHPFLLTISYSYSDNTITATQYSTVSNSKETYIICNMTVFCGEEETKTLEVPNE